MTPSSKKTPSHDPLADLDDDLGDDWESAFQAEDFMFSPEEEPSDFFLFDENAPGKQEDIADLLAGHDDKEAAPQPGKSAKVSGPVEDEEGTGVLEFPGRFQILIASLLQLFQTRPRYQRVLIATLPLALLLIFTATLFLRSTTEQLASLDEQAGGSDTAQTPPTSAPPLKESAPPQQQGQVVAPVPEPAPVAETVQQKWALPTFVIVAGGDNKAELIVNVDITLVANLAKGQTLPTDKQTYVKDLIYQFYVNRPAYELKRFSLARGEMISQLNAWLNKQWQDNPFDTIIFSRYQVTPTAPGLAPKVTFM